MSRLFRLWWLFCGILICTVVSFSALDLLQHLKGTSSPVHVGELFHPGPPALQPFNKLPVPAPRSNQKKTFVFTEHIAALWKLHEGKWSEFTSAASRQIVETCIPPPSKCDSNIHSSFPNVYTNPQPHDLNQIPLPEINRFTNCSPNILVHLSPKHQNHKLS